MKRLHWYRLPAWIGGVLALVLIVTDALVARPPDRVDEVSGYLWASQAALAAGAVWFGWVQPLAEPLRVPMGDSPRRLLALRLWQLWLPSALIGIWAIVAATLAGRELALGRGAANTLVTPVLFIGALVASVPVSAAVSRRFESRYRAFIRNEKHCFECGYDLRGNPRVARCPECGKDRPLADGA